MPLPTDLGRQFSTTAAHARGVSRSRLRARDLDRPFHGVRSRPLPATGGDRYAIARDRELALILALAARLTPTQFFSHRSAALLLGAPMPHLPAPDLHLSVLHPIRAPRVRGVHGHALPAHRVQLARVGGLLITSPVTTFASLGTLSLPELVALGDFLVRKHRPGRGRRNAGTPPICTVQQLREVVALGRWKGIARLRSAVELIREDSWSPKESTTRLMLVSAGLPEPELNIDIFDEHGDFLGCVDMVYRRFRVIIEYQGEQHSERYAEDVERYARLRANGWDVIEVTRALGRTPSQIVARVAFALRKAGWDGSPQIP